MLRSMLAELIPISTANGTKSVATPPPPQLRPDGLLFHCRLATAYICLVDFDETLSPATFFISRLVTALKMN